MHRGIRSAVALLAAAGLLAVAVGFQQPATSDDKGEAPLLPQGPPRFWKGNLHTHSFWSDGDDFPEMIADWYKRHGYHFLGLSDHNILSDGERWIDEGPENGLRVQAVEKYRARYGDSWVERRKAQDKDQVRLKPLREFRSLLEEPGKFLMVPSQELTHRFAKAPVHIGVINIRDMIQPIDGADVAETVRVNLGAVADQKKRTGWRMLAVLNHPNFGWGIRAEDMILAHDLRFFEVFNGHASVRNHGDEIHPSCERMWDIVLALRLGKHRLPVVYGLGTDDAHNYHSYAVGKSNPGRAWVMVRAPFLSGEALVRSMEAGDFYLSTGVVLDDVSRQGNEIRVDIRKQAGVAYKTQFIATFRDAVLSSEPRLDADGKPLDVTRLYSTDIGKVVGESDEANPRYRLTGKELYVRAKVTSSKPHPNPHAKGDVEVAWTQPFLP